MSKLQYLDPLKPLEGLNVLKRPNNQKDCSEHFVSEQSIQNDLFAPINVFGSSHVNVDVPELPNLKNRSPKTLRMVDLKKSGRMNPLYYKTRDIHASYNSLMNKLYPKESSESLNTLNIKVSTDFTTPKIPEVSSENIKTKNHSKELNNSLELCEDPINIKFSESFKKSENSKGVKSLQDYLDNLEVVETYTERSLTITPKNYDLEDILIDVINLSKKQCVVWYDGETLPYGKFRQNPDNVIFIVGEDAYGYSKANLHKEYIQTMKSKIKDSKPLDSKNFSSSDRSLYFDLNLNWEDNETLWIPMNQILKVLEYSHPVYELQKMKYSMHVWNLIPVKLK